VTIGPALHSSAPTPTSSTRVAPSCAASPSSNPSAVATLVRDYVGRGGAGQEQFDVLTPREFEVLELIAEARSSKEIAKELVISIKTVERHRQTSSTSSE
jgi:DNA-binding NarL/FixJ family response regulator